MLNNTSLCPSGCDEACNQESLGYFAFQISCAGEDWQYCQTTVVLIRLKCWHRHEKSLHFIGLWAKQLRIAKHALLSFTCCRQLSLATDTIRRLLLRDHCLGTLFCLPKGDSNKVKIYTWVQVFARCWCRSNTMY